MPERSRPGGEWRWRSPSAKQLSGLSGICRLNSVQASQGMASSRRLSGDISGAGVRCPAQPNRAGACWIWTFRNGPTKSSVSGSYNASWHEAEPAERAGHTTALAAVGWSAASFRIRTADGWLEVDGIVRPPFGIDQRATDETGNGSNRNRGSAPGDRQGVGGESPLR